VCQGWRSGPYRPSQHLAALTPNPRRASVLLQGPTWRSDTSDTSVPRVVLRALDHIPNFGSYWEAASLAVVRPASCGRAQNWESSATGNSAVCLVARHPELPRSA
jgi:hypothetical protein